MGKRIFFIKRIWVFLLILLIISITPVSAVEYGELSSEMNATNTKLVQETNDVAQHGINVKDNANDILNYARDILDRTCYIAKNCYKWWKLSEVWNSICQIGIDVYNTNNKVDDTSDEGFGTASSSFQLVLTSVSSFPTITEFGKMLDQRIDSDLKIDNPQSIKLALQNTPHKLTLQNTIHKNKSTNMDFTSDSTTPRFDSIPIGELEEGDIVDYKSQGKYDRYLEFITADNQTVYLQGPYGKAITMNYNDFTLNYSGSAIKAEPDHIKTSPITVNKLYNLQKDEIQKRINTNQNDRVTTTESTNRFGLIGIIFAILMVIGVVGGIITFYNKKKYAKSAHSLKKAQADLIKKDNHNREVMSASNYQQFPLTPSIQALIDPIEKATALAKDFQIAFYVFVVIGCIGLLGAVIFTTLWAINYLDLCKLNKEAGILSDKLNDLNSWAVTDNLTAPVADSLNFTTHEGSSVNTSFNGSDIYDDPLSYSTVSQPINGTVTMNGVDGFIYKSNNGFTGKDTFSYRANDDIWNLFSNVANVTVTVNPDQAPVASNMSLFTATNTPLNSVLDVNDPDNDTFACSLVGGPLYGTLNLNRDGSFVYTPFDNFTGEDSFSFKANDTVLDSNIGNVTIHVVNNTSPVAYNLVFNIGQNNILNSKFNVKSINGTEQLFNIISKPEHGVLNIFGGNFSYKPVKNYNGRDMFTYKFTDVLNQTSNLATIQIFIRSPPTAESFKLSTGMNKMINSAFKIRGYNSTSKVLSKPQHGTLTVLSNERFSYKPNKDYTGKDTFTYQSVDKLGQKSPVATVTLTVTKPKPHILKPSSGVNILNKPVLNMNTPHLNTPHLDALNLNIKDLNNTLNSAGLNMSNINPENPNQLITDPLLNFIKKLVNNIKTTVHNIKL